jgi:hypothetical protein
MKLLLNGRVVDMFKDTEIKGAYKPISVDSDNITANPHSYEFQIPLTENNADILGFNRDTYQFESEDIKAAIYNWDDELVLAGYAYVNSITIEKLGEQVAIQVVDFFTYILKKFASKNIGEIYSYDNELNTNYRYTFITALEAEVEGFMKYMYLDTTGYKDQASLYDNKTFVYNGGIGAKGEVPLCINPYGYLKRLAKAFGCELSLGKNSSILKDVWTTIPIDGLRMGGEYKDKQALKVNTTVSTSTALFSGYVDCNLKSSPTTTASIWQKTGEADEFKMFRTFSERDRKTYDRNILPTYLESETFSFYIKVSGSGGATVSKPETTGGNITLAVDINDTLFVVGRGVINKDGTGFARFALNEEDNENFKYNADTMYLQPVAVEAGEDIVSKFLIIADNPITIKPWSDRHVIFAGSTVTESSNSSYESAIKMEIFPLYYSCNINLTLTDIKLDGEEERTLCGSIDIDDSGYKTKWGNNLVNSYRNKFYTASEIDENDPNVIDLKRTLNSSKTTVETYIKDFMNRFNVSFAMKGENNIELSIRGFENEGIINLDNRLDGDITVSKNGSDNSIEYFQITNAGGSLFQDKYSDGATTGSSEKMYVDELSKTNKTTSLQSSIVTPKMYKSQNVISDSQTDSLTEIANIPPLFNITPCETATRKDYGIRYGIDSGYKGKYYQLVQKVGNDLQAFYYNVPDSAFIATSCRLKSTKSATIKLTNSSNTLSFTADITNGYVCIDSSKKSYFTYSTAGDIVYVTMTITVDGATFEVDTSCKGTVHSTSTGVTYGNITKSGNKYGVGLTYGLLNQVSGFDLYIPIKESSSNSLTETSFFSVSDEFYTMLSTMSMSNGEVSLSFRDTDTQDNENTVNAIDYFFGDVLKNVYSSKTLYIEGSFYLKMSEIITLLLGSSFHFGNNDYLLVEANDIDYTNKNGCIVKLKLAKKWQ